MQNLVEMWRLAKQARNNAYAPYSNHFVGACIRSQQGRLYAGANVEDVAFTSICAEASAISAMVTAGDTRIKDIVIIGSNGKLCPPCGSCRQRILEFGDHNTTIYLDDQTSDQADDEKKAPHRFSIDDLLPFSYPI